MCSEPLRWNIETLRGGVYLLAGSGEHVPLADNNVDLVVCCNVLDHVQDADAVLAEMKRVMHSAGSLFLEVDTFSIVGWVKWHGLTKHLHANEILVRAHPYRFLEKDVAALLKKHGFTLVHRASHRGWGRFVGASRPSSFFAIRQ